MNLIICLSCSSYLLSVLLEDIFRGIELHPFSGVVKLFGWPAVPQTIYSTYYDATCVTVKEKNPIKEKHCLIKSDQVSNNYSKGC